MEGTIRNTSRRIPVTLYSSPPEHLEIYILNPVEYSLPGKGSQLLLNRRQVDLGLFGGSCNLDFKRPGQVFLEIRDIFGIRLVQISQSRCPDKRDEFSLYIAHHLHNPRQIVGYQATTTGQRFQ